MNKIYFIIFFSVLFSSQLSAQTFIHLRDVENEFNRLERNYLVHPRAIKIKSDLYSTYDSCHIHTLYNIIDTEVVSKEIPRINCFCKNGDKTSFSNSRNNDKSDYPAPIVELLNQIKTHVDSPIIIVNKDKIPNTGKIYLGAITVTFEK